MSRTALADAWAHIRATPQGARWERTQDPQWEPTGATELLADAAACPEEDDEDTAWPRDRPGRDLDSYHEPREVGPWGRP